MSDNVQLFEDRRIRTAWDEEREETIDPEITSKSAIELNQVMTEMLEYVSEMKTGENEDE